MAIILIDAECVLCNKAALFIIKRDNGYFKFAGLQSDVGQKLLSTYNIDASLSSVILIENDVAYTKSDASLNIAIHLKHYAWLKIFKLIPKALRNAVYDFIARNRIKLWGRTNTCLIAPERMAK